MKQSIFFACAFCLDFQLYRCDNSKKLFSHISLTACASFSGVTKIKTLIVIKISSPKIRLEFRSFQTAFARVSRSVCKLGKFNAVSP